MKWQGRRKSANVSDQRGGGLSGRARVTGGLGGLGLIAAIILFLVTGDPGSLGGLLGELA